MHGHRSPLSYCSFVWLKFSFNQSFIQDCGSIPCRYTDGWSRYFSCLLCLCRVFLLLVCIYSIALGKLHGGENQTAPTVLKASKGCKALKWNVWVCFLFVNWLKYIYYINQYPYKRKRCISVKSEREREREKQKDRESNKLNLTIFVKKILLKPYPFRKKNKKIRNIIIRRHPMRSLFPFLFPSSSSFSWYKIFLKTVIRPSKNCYKTPRNRLKTLPRETIAVILQKGSNSI